MSTPQGQGQQGQGQQQQGQQGQGQQGQGQQGQGGPTTAELATRIDGLAERVETLITAIGKQGTSPAGGGGPDPAAQAADLQSMMQAEVKKLRDQEAAEAAARGEKDWRDRVDQFIARHPETAPAEPQKGLRGIIQRGLVGGPRQQREQQPAPPVPAAAPPGGGGRR